MVDLAIFDIPENRRWLTGYWFRVKNDQLLEELAAKEGIQQTPLPTTDGSAQPINYHPDEEIEAAIEEIAPATGDSFDYERLEALTVHVLTMLCNRGLLPSRPEEPRTRLYKLALDAYRQHGPMGPSWYIYLDYRNVKFSYRRLEGDDSVYRRHPATGARDEYGKLVPAQTHHNLLTEHEYYTKHEYYTQLPECRPLQWSNVKRNSWEHAAAVGVAQLRGLSIRDVRADLAEQSQHFVSSRRPVAETTRPTPDELIMVEILNRMGIAPIKLCDKDGAFYACMLKPWKGITFEWIAGDHLEDRVYVWFEDGAWYSVIRATHEVLAARFSKPATVARAQAAGGGRPH